MTGLTNGMTYTFKVRAKNRKGDGRGLGFGNSYAEKLHGHGR